MISKRSGPVAKAAASLLALGLVAQAGAAAAQPSDYYQQDGGPPSGRYAPPPEQYGPPPGQYAPPPDDYAGSDYDAGARQSDQGYADAYSRWASRYCVDRRNNAAAGAVIGGVLGAIVGSGVAGRGSHTGGAIVGGALGATAGAAIGSSSDSRSACPPGYDVGPGAPEFYYQGYAPTVAYGPAWYNPWIFVGGRWSYRPYRSWYYDNRSYWRPGWGGRHGRRRY